MEFVEKQFLNYYDPSQAAFHGKSNYTLCDGDQPPLNIPGLS